LLFTSARASRAAGSQAWKSKEIISISTFIIPYLYVHVDVKRFLGSLDSLTLLISNQRMSSVKDPLINFYSISNRKYFIVIGYASLLFIIFFEDYKLLKSVRNVSQKYK
jgi:hypothetical protein